VQNRRKHEDTRQDLFRDHSFSSKEVVNHSLIY
jgi:hypothetical protein